MIRGFVGDVRLAVRSRRAAPAVAIAAVLALTLAIGATTAIFSVARGGFCGASASACVPTISPA